MNIDYSTMLDPVENAKIAVQSDSGTEMNSQDRVRGPSMSYKRLGSTGLKVSQIILGAMGYGSPAWQGWVLAEDQFVPNTVHTISTEACFD